MFEITIQKEKTSHYYAIFICLLASLFYFYDYFIQVAPGVMTQQLMQSFSIGAGKLGILSACFYYSYTLMQIPAGILLDRLGARVLMTLAVLASAIGITLFGVTYSFTVAGLARFIVGLGSSFSFISALFLISRWFAHRHFSAAVGMVQLIGGMGSLFGLAPLSLLINSLGWRRSMVLTGLVTFGFAFLFWIFIRDGKRVQQTSNNHAASSVNEWYRLKFLLCKSQVWWISSIGFVSWIPVGVIGALWGVPYFMKIYGLTNTEAGKLCSLFWMGLGIGSPLMGWISNYFHNRCAPLACCFLLGLIGSMLIVNAQTISIGIIGIALMLLGILSSAQSLSFGLLKDIVPPAYFGTAAGINNMAAILGGAISQSLVGYLLHLGWSGLKVHGVPVYSVINYRAALLLLPITALIGFGIVSLKIKETFCRMKYSEHEEL